MALTLPNNVRSAACDAIVDLIDVGGGTSYLVIGTAGMAATLVQCAFSATAFGAALNGVATANAIADGTCTEAGTAAAAKIIDKDGSDVITGLTVGLAASNINLSSLTLAINDKVSITSMTCTVPAS